MPIEVVWTGEYPCLCHGEWIVKVGKKKLHIPEDKVHENMNTFGTYSSWYFKDWMEEWEDYKDGLVFDDWIKENVWLCKEIERTLDLRGDENMVLAKRVFAEINKQDWRFNSCGGCI